MISITTIATMLATIVLSQIPITPPDAPYLTEPPNGVGAIMPGPAVIPGPPAQYEPPTFGPGYYGIGMPGGCVVPRDQSQQGGWTYLGSYSVPQYYHVYRPWKWVPTYSVQWHVESAGPAVTTGGGTGSAQPVGPAPCAVQPGPYYGPPSHPTPNWYSVPPAAPQQQMMQQQQQTSNNNVIIVPSTSSRRELPTLDSLRRKHAKEVARCFARS